LQSNSLAHCWHIPKTRQITPFCEKAMFYYQHLRWISTVLYLFVIGKGPITHRQRFETDRFIVNVGKNLSTVSIQEDHVLKLELLHQHCFRVFFTAMYMLVTSFKWTVEYIVTVLFWHRLHDWFFNRIFTDQRLLTA